MRNHKRRVSNENTRSPCTYIHALCPRNGHPVHCLLTVVCKLGRAQQNRIRQTLCQDVSASTRPSSGPCCCSIKCSYSRLCGASILSIAPHSPCCACLQLDKVLQWCAQYLECLCIQQQQAAAPILALLQQCLFCCQPTGSSSSSTGMVCAKFLSFSGHCRPRGGVLASLSPRNSCYCQAALLA
jgi:hypothetical protein